MPQASMNAQGHLSSAVHIQLAAVKSSEDAQHSMVSSFESGHHFTLVSGHSLGNSSTQQALGLTTCCCTLYRCNLCTTWLQDLPQGIPANSVLCFCWQTDCVHQTYMGCLPAKHSTETSWKCTCCCNLRRSKMYTTHTRLAAGSSADKAYHQVLPLLG